MSNLRTHQGLAPNLPAALRSIRTAFGQRTWLRGASLLAATLATAAVASAGGTGTFPYAYTVGNPGDFYPPSDVAVYADGDVAKYVYVADRGSAYRILRYNGTGQTSVLSASVALPKNNPYSSIGLAANDLRGSPGFGSVYACQTGTPAAGRLWTFDTNLALVRAHDLTGVVTPNDVALDADGNVYVSDANTKSVYMYTAASVLSAPLAIAWTKSFSNTVAPISVSVDHNDRVHTASFGLYQVFDPDTTLKATGSATRAMAVCALNPCADGYVARLVGGQYDFVRENWNWNTTTGAIDLSAGQGWIARPEGIEYQKFTYGIYSGQIAPYWEPQRCDERMFVATITAQKRGFVRTFGQTYDSVPVPNGRRAWWRFEQTQTSSTPQLATDYLDALGSNSAVPGGSIVPRTVEGMVRSAFDTRHGTAYLTAADDATLDFGSGSMTIEGWLCSEQRTGVATLLDKRVGTGAGYSLFLYQGRVGFQTNVGNSYQNYVPGTGTADQAAVGAWKHFAVVLDRTNVPNTIRVYVDGVQIGTAGTPPAGSLDNTGPLYFGRTNGGSTPFVGAMDEVTLYDQPLSAAQVLGIFQARCAGKHVFVATTSGT